jgi:hypothetical protein
MWGLTGQAQWREMEARNMSFWNLPSAVIFSHNQNAIATDIFTGRADVGMVRARDAVRAACACALQRQIVRAG